MSSLINWHKYTVFSALTIALILVLEFTVFKVGVTPTFAFYVLQILLVNLLLMFSKAVILRVSYPKGALRILGYEYTFKKSGIINCYTIYFIMIFGIMGQLLENTFKFNYFLFSILMIQTINFYLLINLISKQKTSQV